MTGQFDELIHPRPRLTIVALLAATDWAEFSFVRDELELSDSALSKQLSTLEQAGYVRTSRPGTGRPRRVRVELTEAGRRAFEEHMAALRELAAGMPAAATADTTAAATDAVAP